MRKDMRRSMSREVVGMELAELQRSPLQKHMNFRLWFCFTYAHRSWLSLGGRWRH